MKNDGSPDKSKPQPSKVTPPKNARPTRQKRRKLPSSIPDHPAPANGKSVYGVGEFLQILYQYSPRKRRKIVKKMTEFNFVPVSESSLYRLYAKHEKGERFEFDALWHQCGRPPRINNARLEECVAKLAESHGMKEIKDKVNHILIDEE